MIRHALLISALYAVVTVHGVKQQLQLSDSYLPVAMQVIAHLTDQMAFEIDEVTPAHKPTTPKPTYVTASRFRGSFLATPRGWWMSYATREPTTPFHKPGLYAPTKPGPDRYKSNQQRFLLLPFEQHAPYTVIRPQGSKTQDPLLSIHHEQIKPLIGPSPNAPHFLPPHSDVKLPRSDDEFSEENLQYLSNNVRELIKMARDPTDERVVDTWEDIRSGPEAVATKAKLSTSNLRLLLLYDLLSRDAKRQRLSEFVGFSPSVMKVLVDSSNGGAREQLRMALSKMVERKDCGHDYANNRAREMVEELGRDESKLSSELRYLQPLVYKY